MKALDSATFRHMKLVSMSGQHKPMYYTNIDSRMLKLAAHLTNNMKKNDVYWYQLIAVRYDGSAVILREGQQGRTVSDKLGGMLNTHPHKAHRTSANGHKGPSLEVVEALAIQLLDIGCTSEQLTALNGKGLQATFDNYKREMERRTAGMKDSN